MRPNRDIRERSALRAFDVPGLQQLGQGDIPVQDAALPARSRSSARLATILWNSQGCPCFLTGLKLSMRLVQLSSCSKKIGRQPGTPGLPRRPIRWSAAGKRATLYTSIRIASVCPLFAESLERKLKISTSTAAAIAFVAMFGLSGTASAAEICQGFGPQTPRDIAGTAGSNPRIFASAPPASQLNLCNIHTHTNAEHNGPGFSVTVSMAVTNARKPSR